MLVRYMEQKTKNTVHTVPRVVIAGTNSGCGKTTVVCSLLQALKNRGHNIGAFKCGPDYIDPMFHKRIIGTDSFNLDSFFFDDETLRYLLCRNGDGRDINILEGVMGFYDGIGFDTSAGSTCEIAQITDSPVVLVVGACGAAASVLAVIHGFLTYLPDNHICGVILNQCTGMTYQLLAGQIQKRFGGNVIPLGYLPAMPGCSLESRHLGLVTADEVENLRDKMQKLSEQAEKSLDLDGLLEMAGGAGKISCREPDIPVKEPVRIAVARDRAFCFYYEDSLDLLRQMGAEIVPFSPLADRDLPANIHGLYLGGGYPELYADKLEENRSMREAVCRALKQGLPCIAECGGFMYLSQSLQLSEDPKDRAQMTGFFPDRSFPTGHLTRFGYITLTAQQDNMLCPEGGSVRAHEFHYWDVQDPGHGFKAVKPSGKSWQCVHVSDRLYAGFPHFHFYSNPAFAERFIDACLACKKEMR